MLIATAVLVLCQGSLPGESQWSHPVAVRFGPDIHFNGQGTVDTTPGTMVLDKRFFDRIGVLGSSGDYARVRRAMFNSKWTDLLWIKYFANASKQTIDHALEQLRQQCWKCERSSIKLGPLAGIAYSGRVVKRHGGGTRLYLTDGKRLLLLDYVRHSPGYLAPWQLIDIAATIKDDQGRSIYREVERE